MIKKFSIISSRPTTIWSMPLDLKDCFGRLSWKENHIEITFDLSVAKDESIKLTLKDIPDVSWLHELFDKKNRYVEFLQLKGQDIEGNAIISDSVILNSLRQKSDKKGLRLSPVGTASQLRVDSAKPVTYGNTTELLVM